MHVHIQVTRESRLNTESVGNHANSNWHGRSQRGLVALSCCFQVPHGLPAGLHKVPLSPQVDVLCLRGVAAALRRRCNVAPTVVLFGQSDPTRRCIVGITYSRQGRAIGSTQINISIRHLLVAPLAFLRLSGCPPWGIAEPVCTHPVCDRNVHDPTTLRDVSVLPQIISSLV